MPQAITFDKQDGREDIAFRLGLDRHQIAREDQFRAIALLELVGNLAFSALQRVLELNRESHGALPGGNNSEGDVL